MISASTKIPETTFDLIVIGAGINGAGIARDAAMRGLSVLLLDKGDVGSGTSSWSTRLIHGGLRYLEHGEFGLVRESLREREALLKIAPHLVRPLPILIPVYKGARRGRWTLNAGMIAYDLLSLDKSLPRHRMLSRDDVLKRAPALNPEGLIGAALYYDAQVAFAERLVVENALSAIEHGATIITYAEVTNLVVQDGKINAVEFTSERGAQTVSGRIVINAAGPWVDQILEKTEAVSPRLIGGTKGSHIIVRPFDGAPELTLYVEARSDRRPFFIIPWNGKYLIGTTDIRFQGNLDDVQIDEQEVNYLVGETNRVLPGANLTRAQILYTYSGVRPLPFTSQQDEQSITRRHFIRQHRQIENLLSIVGGKLTTHRSLAEDAVDKAFGYLGRAVPRSRTADTPLPGAGAAEISASSGVALEMNGPIDALVNDRLLRIYGTRSSGILNLIKGDPSLAEVVDEETGATGAEVVFAFQCEMAQTLADCLLRRTMVGLNSSCGLNAVESAGRIAQTHLGWSDQRTEREIADYKIHVERFLLPGSSLAIK